MALFLRLPHFKGDKELAYQAHRAERTEAAQRWIVLAGGGLFGIAGLWVSFFAGEVGSGFATTSLAVLIATFMLYGLSFTSYLKARLDLVPMVLGLGFGAAIVMGILFLPETATLRFAYMSGALALLIVLSAPTLQSAIAALVAEAMVLTLGLVVIYPMQDTPISFFGSLVYTLPLFGMAVGLGYALERGRREAFSFKHELSRRATTDTISGVSNRAHINQSVQNEFGRARRYKEPLSVMMIEIDGYDEILNTWGPMAADTLVQVFSGYCVLVMRHCDSFGRLGPNRFMAILPETPGNGAHILGSRMCREIAKHDVIVDNEILNFTVSIGTAEVATSDRWAGDILRRTEQALDDAIESGRGQAIMAQAPKPPHIDTAEATGPGAEGQAPARPGPVVVALPGTGGAAPAPAAAKSGPGQSGGAPGPSQPAREAGVVGGISGGLSGGPGRLAGQR